MSAFSSATLLASVLADALRSKSRKASTGLGLYLEEAVIHRVHKCLGLHINHRLAKSCRPQSLRECQLAFLHGTIVLGSTSDSVAHNVSIIARA